MPRILIVALTAILSACASNQPIATAPDATIDASLDRLYIDLDRAALAYRQAMENLAIDEVNALPNARLAAQRLGEISDACTKLPACDLSAFNQQLLGLLDVHIDTQAAVPGSVVDTPPELLAESERDAIDINNELPAMRRSVNLLNGTDLAEIIAVNQPVNAAIEDWLTWNRPLLMQAYENYQYLRHLMAPEFEREGLPEALLFALVATESGGKVHAYSRVGAAGLLQFMPGTGRRFGLQVSGAFDQRLDAQLAARAAVAYLNEQFGRLNNDLEKTLAAYNAGENRLRGMHRRQPGKSFWDPEFFYDLPRETRDYVPRILAAAWLFMHSEDYALEWPELETRYANLELVEPASLGSLTVCLGQNENAPDGWFRVLRNLNPAVKPAAVLDAGETLRVPAIVADTYPQSCVQTELAEIGLQLHKASYEGKASTIPYRIRRGDTLSRIASRHRCTGIREIAALNNIRPPRYQIKIGQVIRVPAC